VDKQTDWSERLMYLATAAVQIASLYMITEHMHWAIGQKLQDQVQRYQRWLRGQEFDLYYRAVWPSKRPEEIEDE
jgi:hypothetical protein